MGEVQPISVSPEGNVQRLTSIFPPFVATLFKNKKQ